MDTESIVVYGIMYAVGIGLIALSCGVGFAHGAQVAKGKGAQIDSGQGVTMAATHGLAIIVTMLPLSYQMDLPAWQTPMACASLATAVFFAFFSLVAAGGIQSKLAGKVLAGIHILRLPLAIIPLFGMSLSAA